MYKTGGEFKDKTSHSTLQSAVGGSSLKRYEVRMMPFSVGSYIMGPGMTESAHHRQVLEYLKDSESLSLGDFIHHDKACISTSIFEAAPFKML